MVRFVHFVLRCSARKDLVLLFQIFTLSSDQHHCLVTPVLLRITSAQESGPYNTKQYHAEQNMAHCKAYLRSLFLALQGALYAVMRKDRRLPKKTGKCGNVGSKKGNKLLLGA